MNKYERILNNVWEELEHNYIESEITFGMWLIYIQKASDSKNCLKQCIKLLWSQCEWHDFEEKEYYRKHIKEYYGIRVVL